MEIKTEVLVQIKDAETFLSVIVTIGKFAGNIDKKKTCSTEKFYNSTAFVLIALDGKFISLT